MSKQIHRDNSNDLIVYFLVRKIPEIEKNRSSVLHAHCAVDRVGRLMLDGVNSNICRSKNQIKFRKISTLAVRTNE